MPRLLPVAFCTGACLLAGCTLPPEGAPRSLAATADSCGYERTGLLGDRRDAAPSAHARGRPRVPEDAPRRTAVPAARVVAAGGSKEHAFHAPAVVVGVTKSGGYVAGGRTLTAAQLPSVFAAAARKDPATVAIIRPARGAPQSAVQRAADLGNAAGLHCLPFPAR